MTGKVARFPERQEGLGSHWQERVDLAAAFRWTARLNMHESIANHFSLAVSDDGSKFLVNPFGRHFSRMRASDMMLIDANDPGMADHPDLDPTAWAIHGAVHRNVPHARCVMHVHSKHALVLATLKDSRIPPIDQNTMRFFERIAIDEHFGGMGLGEEAERLPGLDGEAEAAQRDGLAEALAHVGEAQGGMRPVGWVRVAGHGTGCPGRTRQQQEAIISVILAGCCEWRCAQASQCR